VQAIGSIETSHTDGMLALMLLDAIPILPVRFVETAVAFYRDQLGFQVRHRAGGLAIVERDGVALHLTQLDDEQWNTRVDLVERPVESGAARLRDQWWGDRDFGVVDPDGNLLTFFQRNAVAGSASG
jgi:catechol 2,3-dioxygenase-like lactoylglutathione lyase family enzyme